MKRFLALFSLALPWPLRRAILRAVFKYEIADDARIGLSLVYPKTLVLKAGARIGHLNVCKDIDRLELGESASIGNLNWITGFPTGLPGHFEHQADRRPELVLGAHAAITNRHLVDCTERVHIGAFATFAGFASQLLTHSINLETSRQEARPITIGDYCFIGTNCVFLGGSALPACSVLGAKSLLNRAYEEKYFLYGGVPAKPIKALPESLAYFQRKVGYVM
ncbi:MAG: acyltransferase [Verrucomicrobiota bacterium]